MTVAPSIWLITYLANASRNLENEDHVWIQGTTQGFRLDWALTANLNPFWWPHGQVFGPPADWWSLNPKPRIMVQGVTATHYYELSSCWIVNSLFSQLWSQIKPYLQVPIFQDYFWSLVLASKISIIMFLYPRLGARFSIANLDFLCWWLFKLSHKCTTQFWKKK